MTDALDDLKNAFDAVTPASDAARRRANLDAAKKAFASRQGSGPELRPTSETGKGFRLLKGVKAMAMVLTTRGGLTVTTALVALAVVTMTPMGRDIWSPRSLDPLGFETRPDVVVTPRERAEPTRKTATDERVDEFVGQADAAETDSPLTEREIASVPRVASPEVASERQEEVFSGNLAVQEMNAAPISGVETRDQAPVAKRLPAPDQSVDVQPSLQSQDDTEAFSNAESSPIQVTRDAPVSTFSIDVDTASYGVVRSSLERGQLPPADAVRVEEMVNYFPYDYPAPTEDVPFSTTISVIETPWNTGTKLVHIGLQGTLPAIEVRPPLNLVFLIDTSGSMQDQSKLPLLKQSFRMMLAELRPEDEVAIVTYAGSAGQVLEPTRASDRGTILAALDRLEAGGSTAGAAGIEQAYLTAERMAADGEVSRVILATDGDFNVGVSDPEDLKTLISEKRDSGTYLSVLGFGRGNLDDATMQALAQNGNGQAAYIDTLSEARKVLVDQLTGALFPIANDVKIQVEFNPAEIAEYRLIGYETRALAREDFNNDRVDAGDIGAGHSVTALYEVTPVGSEAILNGPLRYGASAPEGGDGELGYFKLRYKEPGQSNSRLIETPIGDRADAATNDVRFSVAIAGFGQLLRGGEYLFDWDWSDAISYGVAARGADPFGYRAEALDLMRLAEALSR